MVEKYLSESDIKKLLQCSRCKKVPDSAPIYMCKTGHHECSLCYGKQEAVLLEETDGSTDTEGEIAIAKHICFLCKEEVTSTRNLFAENLLTLLESVKAERPHGVPQMKINFQETKLQNNYVDCCYNIYGSPLVRYDQTIPSVAPYDSQAYSRYQYQCAVPQYNYAIEPYLVPESQPQYEYADSSVYYPEYDNVHYYNSGSRKDAHDRKTKLNNQESVISLAGEFSKRPIRCPTHLCGRTIAVAALSHHFCFDHPDVPPLNIDYDVICQLFIDPEMIPFNYGRCLAILLIPNKTEPVNSTGQSNMVSKIKSSLPLVVMASKLDCSTYTPPGIADIHEDTSTEPLNHGDFQTGNGKSRLLVIWLAGVDTNSSLHTTIQITEKHTNTRSVIYTGPVISLRGSQNTSKIFEQGDCLVIQSGILDNIIGDKGGFDLHVVVH